MNLKYDVATARKGNFYMGITTAKKVLSTTLKKFMDRKLESKYIVDGDWDTFPIPIPKPGRSSFYSGRNELVNKLSSWIVKSGGGSVLISGVRGVGKTAFVYHSINCAHYQDSTIVREDSKKLGYIFHWFWWITKRVIRFLHNLIIAPKRKIIFIPINAPSCLVEISDGGLNKRFQLLTHLIKGYCDSSRGAKKDVLMLYLQSIGDGKEKVIKSAKFKAQLLTKPLTLLFLITLFIYYFARKNLLPDIFGAISERTIMFGMAIEGLLLYLGLFLSSEREVILELENKNYNYLLFKFNQLLNGTRHIIVFVIDELDKIDQKKYSINEFISSIKTLLTISSGRFIFITDDEYARVLAKQTTPKKPYPKTMTFFNWQILLPEIHADEIKTYINNITTKQSMSEELADQFSYYVYAESGGVFTKVKKVIRDFLIFEKGRSYLNLSGGRFDEDHLRIARLGKIYHRVYKQNTKEALSRNYYNHLRHQSLYPILRDIIEGQRPAPLSLENWLGRHTTRFSDAMSEMQRDQLMDELRTFLIDIKKHSSDKELLLDDPPKDLVQEFQYELTLSQVKPGLFGLSDDREKLTKSAERFVKQFRLLNGRLGGLKESLSETSRDSLLMQIDNKFPALFSTAKSLAESLSPERFTDPDEVLRRLSQLEEIRNKTNKMKVKLLGKYFIKNTFEESQVAENEDLKHTLSFLEKDEGIIDSSIFFKYKRKILMISGGKYLKRSIWQKRSIQKPPRNLVAIASNKAFVDSLLAKSFGEQNIVQVKFGRNLQGAPKIIKEAKRLLDISEEVEYTPKVVAVPVPENSPSEYYPHEVFSKKGMILDKIKYSITTSSPHWRAGIVFGCEKSEISPLGDGRFPLIHLYKDEGSEEVRLRLIPSNKVVQKPQEHVLKGIKNGDEIRVLLERDQEAWRHLFVKIGEETITKFEIRRKHLGKAHLVAWGDTKPFKIFIRDILVKLT